MRGIRSLGLVRNPVAIFTATVLLLGSLPAAWAAPRGTPVPAADAQQVNTHVGNLKERPVVAALSGPNLGHVVAWVSYRQDGSSYDIYFQRYNAADEKVGSETRVNSVTVGNQANPSVAGLEAGRFVVVWETPDGSSNGVRVRLFDADGTPLTNEMIVNSEARRYQGTARVAALEGGGFAVVWTSFHSPNDDAEVRAQMFSPFGTRIGGEIVVNETSRYVQSFADLAPLPGGGFVVVWMSAFNQDASPGGIKMRRFAADGAPLGGESLVNAMPSVDLAVPRVAAFGAGGYLVVWQSNADILSSNVVAIRMQRYAASGQKLGPERSVTATPPGTSQYRPSLARLQTGEVAVVWSDLGNQKQRIAVQRIGTNGVNVGGMNIVDEGSSTTSDGYPEVAGLNEPTGPFVAVWRRLPFLTSTASHVFGRRMRIAGDPVALPDTAATETARAVIIDVLANDTDPNAGTGDLRLITSASTQTGTVTVVSNGRRLRYAPSGCATTDLITYTMQASLGTTASSEVAVTITPEAVMAVRGPETAFAGPAGGPISPASRLLRVDNIGCASMDWSGAVSFDGLAGSWFTAGITSGGTPLPPGGSAMITVSPTGAATSLAAGTYLGSIQLENASGGRGDVTRGVTLTVGP
jgi:hypothetical protein